MDHSMGVKKAFVLFISFHGKQAEQPQDQVNRKKSCECHKLPWVPLDPFSSLTFWGGSGKTTLWHIQWHLRWLGSHWALRTSGEVRDVLCFGVVGKQLGTRRPLRGRTSCFQGYVEVVVDSGLYPAHGDAQQTQHMVTGGCPWCYRRDHNPQGPSFRNVGSMQPRAAFIDIWLCLSGYLFHLLTLTNKYFLWSWEAPRWFQTIVDVFWRLQ